MGANHKSCPNHPYLQEGWPDTTKSAAYFLIIDSSVLLCLAVPIHATVYISCLLGMVMVQTSIPEGVGWGVGVAKLFNLFQLPMEKNRPRLQLTEILPSQPSYANHNEVFTNRFFWPFPLFADGVGYKILLDRKEVSLTCPSSPAHCQQRIFIDNLQTKIWVFDNDDLYLPFIYFSRRIYSFPLYCWMFRASQSR